MLDFGCLTNRQGVINVIQDFYKDLYTSTLPTPNIAWQEIRNVGSEDIPEVKRSELRKALKQMDCLLLNKCISEEKIPESWQNAEVVLIFKIGDNTNIANYRPISLLSHLYKLLTKVLTNRLTNKLDFYQPVEQAGFRKKFSTNDRLQTVRTLIEKCSEYNILRDYEKAFDSVETWAVLNAMDELFMIALESSFKKLPWGNKGINVDGTRLSHLRFADDIDVISDDISELKDMLEELQETSKQIGPKMNLNKTKIMTNEQTVITIEGHALENVEEYIYLGHAVRLGKQNQTAEISRRTRLSWAAFGRLGYILKSQSIPINLKRKVYEAGILPVTVYMDSRR
ncbi:uncharacterized protein LOC126743285 [Anthonomus grandis grandis]|uniref:uncharacterized protein LOC126743285 n=1 Tax=Anthonomus grandis grandis TaxID=2921223 RepID=UPI0021653EFA|nr:uncharacterized protein LOC126743285 [Anthonomus grandis grandis]